VGQKEVSYRDCKDRKDFTTLLLKPSKGSTKINHIALLLVNIDVNILAEMGMFTEK
jgi:hypothetical protein